MALRVTPTAVKRILTKSNLPAADKFDTLPAENIRVNSQNASRCSGCLFYPIAPGRSGIMYKIDWV